MPFLFSKTNPAQNLPWGEVMSNLHVATCFAAEPIAIRNIPPMADRVTTHLFWNAGGLDRLKTASSVLPHIYLTGGGGRHHQPRVHASQTKARHITDNPAPPVTVEMLSGDPRFDLAW